MSPRSFVLLLWASVLASASLVGVGGTAPGIVPDRTAAAPLAAPDNSIVLQPFLSGLTLPVLVAHAGDASGRLFVLEQGGRIKVVRNGVVNPAPLLDITTLVLSNGEQGLLGLAFHPQFETNGRFFVSYTAKSPPAVGNNTIAEYVVSPPSSDVANPTPVRTLLNLVDRETNHNGGNMNFGPDGYLYIGTGDEGSGGDPYENAQNPQSLFGKLLRLDVDNGGSPLPVNYTYSIPPTNPFVGNAAYRPEIWALGLRNPWRWSFDRQTGDIFIGDVGQGAWEEIDFLPSGVGGLNLGWDDREGAHCYEPATGCLTAGRTDPILEYSRASNGSGCASITGGYRYRGSAYPALQGVYLYADYCSGRIWKGVPDSGSPTGWTAVEAFQHTPFTISSFGEDENGELYIASFAGTVLKVSSAGPTATPTFTRTPTITPTPCPERPAISVQSTRVNANTMTVSVRSQNSATMTNNAVLSVAFTGVTNAQVTMGNQVDRATPFTVTLPANTTSTQFTIKRSTPGLPMHVNLSVTDRCGAWPSFAGAGPGL